MPWSAKAQALIRDQYRASAAPRLLPSRMKPPRSKLPPAHGLGRGRFPGDDARAPAHGRRYIAAYRRYCWPVSGVEDLRLAPFHLLASEGAVHSDKSHDWHMQISHGSRKRTQGSSSPRRIVS
jgi:protein phosphatase